MFLNETKLDKEFNGKMSDNMVGRKTRLILFIGAFAMLIAGGLSLGLDLAFPDEDGIEIFFPVFCFFMAVFLFVFAFLYRSVFNKMYAKLSQGKETVNKYTFAEDGYEILTTVSDGTTSTAQGNYAGFTEVREYADMWLLYQNKATIFGVSKSGMTEGTAEELSTFFVRVFGDRYKVRYKKK